MEEAKKSPVEIVEERASLPTVRIVSRQILDDDAIDSYLERAGHVDEHGNLAQVGSGAKSDAEEIAEIAGRICYDSFSKQRPGGTPAYLEHILDVGHGSVLEHAVYGFIIDGISRSLSHELVRHRVGTAFSQESQRYVEASKTKFVMPKLIEENEEAKRVFAFIMLVAAEGYKAIETIMTAKGHDKKTARQTARSVLPNACETKIFLTMNVRAIRHFVELRGSRHADWEIRRLANLMYEAMLEESPLLFRDYTTEKLEDGTYEIKTTHPKV